MRNRPKFFSYITIVILLFTISFSSAQNARVLDSLIEQYELGKVEGNNLPILKQIAEKLQNPERKMKYAELLIQEAATDTNDLFLISGYLQKGHAFQLKGDYADALEAYFKSRDFSVNYGDDLGVAAATISIANTYAMIGNFNTANDYYNNGIESLRKIGDSIRIATALQNAGDFAFKAGFYDEALEYLEESKEIFSRKNFQIGLAYSIGTIGMVYADQNKEELARENMNQAIAMLEEQKQYYPISEFLISFSNIYKKQDEIDLAISYATRSLNLAREYNLKDQISEANLKLSELYRQKGDYKLAHDYYRDHIKFRDSITNVGAVQEMARIRTDNEIARKQAEIDLMEQQRRTQKFIGIATAVALLSIIIIAIGLYRRNKYINKTKKIIENERNRSDKLLLNILPEETARELKFAGRVKSKKFEMVSVLFADIVGFTKISETFSPEDLVKKVDNYFSKFDQLMEKYSLEKIKTMGDCYMCAGGLPFPSKEHAVNIVLVAFEMMDYMNEMRMKNKELYNFHLRIGINSGPVVAGVVGSKKFSYDIWGDTVNIASRMESSSEMDKINVSANTYELIKDDFICEYRGEIEVKNKGSMRMYYVKDVKNKALRDDLSTKIPKDDLIKKPV